jgi:hypothetical protein
LAIIEIRRREPAGYLDGAAVAWKVEGRDVGGLPGDLIQEIGEIARVVANVAACPEEQVGRIEGDRVADPSKGNDTGERGCGAGREIEGVELLGIIGKGEQRAVAAEGEVGRREAPVLVGPTSVPAPVVGSIVISTWVSLPSARSPKP